MIESSAKKRYADLLSALRNMGGSYDLSKPEVYVCTKGEYFNDVSAFTQDTGIVDFVGPYTGTNHGSELTISYTGDIGLLYDDLIVLNESRISNGLVIIQPGKLVYIFHTSLIQMSIQLQMLLQQCSLKVMRKQTMNLQSLVIQLMTIKNCS